MKRSKYYINLIPREPWHQRFSSSRFFIIAFIFIFSLVIVSVAIAADLTWNSNTTLSMSGVTFTTITVASGSEATSLIVGASTITVTVPSGSTFTLNASSDITFSNDGDISTTCGTTSSLVVTGPVTSLVVTPTNTACVAVGRTSDTTSPSAPTNAKASAISSRVTLTWTDPTAADLSLIVILRNAGGNTNISGTTYSTVEKGKEKFIDTNVIPGKTYKYYVRSRDSSGNIEKNENEVKVTVPTAASVPTEAGEETATPTETPTETPSEEVVSEEAPVPTEAEEETITPTATSEVIPAKPTISETPKMVSELELQKAEKETIITGVLPVRRTPTQENIVNDAKVISGADTASIAQEAGKIKKLGAEQTVRSTEKISTILAGVSETQVTAAVGFILYGTSTTERLGAGERTGVLNSYKAVYNKLPETEEEWQDAIRIGAGQLPLTENKAAEEKAAGLFKKIYKRDPKITYKAGSTSVLKAEESADQKAIIIAAYGVRPSTRDLTKEQNTIGVFKSTFSKNPDSASDWDVVRMVAYAGVGI